MGDSSEEEGGGEPLWSLEGGRDATLTGLPRQRDVGSNNTGTLWSRIQEAEAERQAAESERLVEVKKRGEGAHACACDLCWPVSTHIACDKRHRAPHSIHDS